MRELVEVEVKNFFRTQGLGGGVFLGNAEKTFAIFIGAAELNALVLAGNGVAPPRPLTHNLIDMVLHGFEVEVKSVVITEIVDDAFHAALTLAQDGREVELDCRPSDALVLAALRKKQIFVTRKLFEEVEDGAKLLASMKAEATTQAGEKPQKKAKKAARRTPAAAPESAKPKNRVAKYFDVREEPGIDWDSAN